MFFPKLSLTLKKKSSTTPELKLTTCRLRRLLTFKTNLDYHTYVHWRLEAHHLYYIR